MCHVFTFKKHNYYELFDQLLFLICVINSKFNLEKIIGYQTKI